MSLQLAPAKKAAYRQRGISAVQLLFKNHFQSFAEQYEEKYAMVYGRFRTQRSPRQPSTLPHGLNKLQRTGTLPTAWIHSSKLRDLRDLSRTRMVLSRERTRLKNRIHSTLARYGIAIEGASDAFGKRGRAELEERLDLLPSHTAFAVEILLEQLKETNEKIALFEGRMREAFEESEELELLKTIPGVEFILEVVNLLEVGDVGIFPGDSWLASYSGTTPRVHASGDKVRHGQLRADVNRYLKWAIRQGGKCYRYASSTFSIPACQPAVPEDPSAQGTPKGGGSGSSASGGGFLLDTDEEGAVSGTSTTSGFVHEGASAFIS